MDKQALIDLKAKVEAGEWNNFDAIGLMNEAEILYRSAFKDDYLSGWRAYHGSVDAALSLLEAVLPGWHWEKSTTLTKVGLNDKFQRSVMCVFKENEAGVSAEADTPSRALLIAILSALIEGA